MTIENIKSTLKNCKDKIDIDNTIKLLEDTLYDYELELGNIVCIFTYNKDTYYELSLLTCPNKDIPRIKVDKLN